MPLRKSGRDFEILVAFEAGRTIEQLMVDYALTDIRVRAIIIAERHRRAVSPEPFYRALRRTQPSLSASFLKLGGSAN
jgi:Mor family transcriptional regulator